MEFKSIKTYGRFRNRVVKTDLWISPQVQRNRLFQVSTSSESSNNSSVCQQDPAITTVSDDSERDNKSSSSGKISQNVSSVENSFKSLSNYSNSQNLSQPPSLDKDNNSPVVVEHSTPFSANVGVRPRRFRLPVISPLVVSEPPFDPAVCQDSPILFPDTSQEHCNSSANEVDNCINKDSTEELDEIDLSSKSERSSGTRTSLEMQIKLQKLSNDDIQNISDKMRQTLSLNESSSFTSNVNDFSDESGSERDAHAKAQLSMESDYQITSIQDSLGSTKNSSSENHPTDVANDKTDRSPQNQSGNVRDMSEKKQDCFTESEIMNELTNVQNSRKKSKSVSINYEIKNINVTSRKKVLHLNKGPTNTIDSILIFDHDLSNGTEYEDNNQLHEPLALNAHTCNSNDRFSRENPSQSNQVVCDEWHGSLSLNGNSCTQSISNEMGGTPLKYKCIYSNDTSQDRKNLSTREQHQSLGIVSDISESHDHSYKNLSRQGQDSSNSVQCTSSKNDSRTASNCHDMINHMPGKDPLQDECELDDVNPSSTHEASYSAKPVHHTKQATSMDAISKKLKELRLLDAKIYLDKEECLRSSSSDTVTNNSKTSTSKNLLDGVNTLPSGDVHPPTHSESDLPPSSNVHPPLSSNNVPPQPLPGNLDKNGFAEKVTPKNIDVHTPTSGQRTGKMVKNPNFSSFVEALTPARFKRNRPLSSKKEILMQCEQQKPLKFAEVLSPSVLAKCIKVGEGTYGEVYKTNDGVEDVALKVIPVEGNFTVNDEPQKSFEEMIPEIVISKELSNLADCEDVQNDDHVCSNFIKVKRVMLVQDNYPEKFLNEWDKWKSNHNCENERPDMFQSKQYFVVFEFTDGGEDLERFQFACMDEALSVLQQVTLALAVAEQSLLFEHRDLHWGNVLIKRSKRKTICYKLCGEDIVVKSAGVFVSIIDFTLSRLTKDGLTVFCDLSKDPDIFKGKGDYQFQVYRLMRKQNDDDWGSHEPSSNVLWLHYLIDKILNAKKCDKANNGLQRDMKTYLRRIKSYESATQAVEDGCLGIDVSKLK